MYPSFETKALETDPSMGTGVMRDLLLTQYQNSPILLQYFDSFFKEFDTTFLEAQKMYQGRFLEYATGHQLTVIGNILGLSRSIQIDRVFFGMSDEVTPAVIVDGMADEATPADGGYFYSELASDYEVIPLDDATYRTMLRVKALCMANFYKDINFAYECVGILLDRIPPNLRFVTVGVRQVSLTMSASYVSIDKAQVVDYMSQYFVPAGTVLTINII